MCDSTSELTQNLLLVEPTPKKNVVFPRKYPFPIIKSETQENNQWNCIIGHLKDHCVEVTDEENSKILFTMGFFGKGTLSKSMPRALEESLRKEGLKKKRKRSWSKSKDKSSQNNDSQSNADLEIVVCDEDSQENLAKHAKTDEIEVVSSDSNIDENSNNSNINIENEDNDLLASSTVTDLECDKKEALQLTFEEAFFLSYGLGCLVVKDKDQPLDLMRLWYRFCELHPTQNFPVMYTAYHHFRSKGWIVKCGLKYGVDYVLYKDGPPFYHSTYAVIVKPVKEQNLRDITSGSRPSLTWSSLAGLNRICTHVSKTVMILYVIKPTSISENKISTPFCVSQYKLEEVILKRWVPSENRFED